MNETVSIGLGVGVAVWLTGAIQCGRKVDADSFSTAILCPPLGISQGSNSWLL